MRNDSIETLLLRHYGSASPAPSGLEQQLIASIRREAAETSQQHTVAARIRNLRISRRRAVQLVAVGSAGIGLLGLGLESLQAFELALLGQEKTQPAFP